MKIFATGSNYTMCIQQPNKASVSFQKKYGTIKPSQYAIGTMVAFASLVLLNTTNLNCKKQEKSLPKTEFINKNTSTSSEKPDEIDSADYNTKVYVNGRKLKQTKGEIEAYWTSEAKKFARTKRPELCLDKDGNISAFIKEYEPVTSGLLSDKVIIINQGHGGCVANPEYPDIIAFDPGACNNVTEPIRGKNGRFRRNKDGSLILKESNQFIGNNGKALEEWDISNKYAKELTNKLTKEGAKVLFVSGAVRNARNAIREYQTKNKVDLIISLHCDAFENITTAIGKNEKEYIKNRIAPSGYLLMPNIRGGFADKEDYELALKMNDTYHKDSLFTNQGEIQRKSLGVLSLNDYESSPVPGILIEIANLKNYDDVKKLISDDYRKRFVEVTARGIASYFNDKCKNEFLTNKWAAEPYKSLFTIKTYKDEIQPIKTK